ncbi:cysteine-rich receptor-like protein kinase 3 [Phoenix dactylifera]|uniref:Cysteine-rich receptor-like protein kinase 3 n=1 Tax=Phoenix dactylifera TaxID=42345 RepID=A0A8B7BTJ3_PHODC|nr:cysteine-rich receptor-like protein kinase 3 [Phoenix dactylifera]
MPSFLFLGFSGFSRSHLLESKMSSALDIIIPFTLSLPSLLKAFPVSILKASPPVLFLVLVLLLSSVDLSVASRATLICGTRTAAPSDRLAFAKNLRSAMEAIAPQVSSKRYARVVAGTSADDRVYASGECSEHLSRPACHRCIAWCKAQILRCFPGERPTRGARIYLDGCHLRFDDYDFFGEAPGLDNHLVCSDVHSNGNRTAFATAARKFVGKSSMRAPPNDSFFAASVGKENSSVHGLGPCWKFVNKRSCPECLPDAGTRIGHCFPKQGASMLRSGCYMRYPISQLHNDFEIHVVVAGRHIIKLPVVFPIVVILMLIMVLIFFGKRKVETRTVRKQLGALAATVIKSSLHFNYEMLERATNYFDSSNKLGQGGSGSVFKGVLLDDRVVAVKRLFFHTGQWEKFFNEINLISTIDHKNLVKLLGCSITGPESLLVYEYVPNKSLCYYFSDRRNAQLLSWEMRYNIIVGAAEGLAYLHEESQLRIVHRDIKLSNILLDESYSPKIADFGLVRLLPGDKTHITTAIAGTLGYMAPEYLASGKLTEKADVFSFGVLLIEVVTGKRNNSRKDEQSNNPLGVLQMVWNCYTSNRMLEAVDPVLEGNFPLEKASRALHIGLLCAQLSAELRPSMSAVVKMLKEDDTITQPTPPPFLGYGTENASAAPKKIYSQHGSSASSINSTTISILEPR